MALRKQRELGSTRAALERIWSDRYAAKAAVTSLEIPQGIGYSNETLLASIRWEPDGVERTDDLVVRLPPDPDLAVFPDYDLRKQALCMERIADLQLGIPVPRIWFFESDASLLGAPFYVMSRVGGRVPSDNPPYTTEGWLFEAASEDQRSLYRSTLKILADLHRIENAEQQFSFLASATSDRPGLAGQISDVVKLADICLSEAPNAVISAAIDFLTADVPDDGGLIGLNWGDSRCGNILYDRFQPAAVLDWEMAALGPAEVDVAWLLVMQRFHAALADGADLPGFLSKNEAIDEYEELLGRDLLDLSYFEVFAMVRFALILTRIVGAVIRLGLMPADWDYARVNPVTAMLADRFQMNLGDGSQVSWV